MKISMRKVRRWNEKEQKSKDDLFMMIKMRRTNEKEPRNNEDNLENTDEKNLDGSKCYSMLIILMRKT